MKLQEKPSAAAVQTLDTSNLRNGGLVSVATVLFLLPAGPMSYSATAAEIVVSWTAVQQQLRPLQRTFRMPETVRLSLRGGNVITHGHVATTAGNSHSSSTEGHLGKPSEKTKALWSVKDSKTLVRTYNEAQHTSVVTVVRQSDTSCAATVSFALKPGFREYLVFRYVDGVPTYIRSISAENVTCRINP